MWSGGLIAKLCLSLVTPRNVAGHAPALLVDSLATWEAPCEVVCHRDFQIAFS